MISEVKISEKCSEFQFRECPGSFLSCFASLFHFRGWHIKIFSERVRFPDVKGVGREFCFGRGK